MITAFVQDKSALERGLFDAEHVGGETMPQELTQLKMGKIIRDRYPDLDDEDREAVRQHAIAALNITQKAKELASIGDTNSGDPSEQRANTALLDGVRQFALEVKDLDIDLIDSINPFQAAYSVLAKSMSEGTLKQVAAVIGAKRTTISVDEAKDLATRALRFKRERGRLPEITSADAWEKRLAEGAAAFVRYKDEGRYD